MTASIQMQKSSVIVDDLNMSNVVMLNQPLISNLTVYMCKHYTIVSKLRASRNLRHL